MKDDYWLLSAGWRLLGDLLVVQEPQPHRNEGAFGRTQAGRKHKTYINVINSSWTKIPYGTKPYFTLTSKVMAPASNSYQPAYPSMEMDEKESNM